MEEAWTGIMSLIYKKKHRNNAQMSPVVHFITAIEIINIATLKM